MTSSDLQAYYSNRVANFQKDIENLKNNEWMLSMLRIGLFVLFVVGILYFANEKSFNAIVVCCVLFVVLFGLVVKKHNEAKFNHLQKQYLIDINNNEISRVEGQLHDLPTGIEYLDNQHSYAPDLDVFGRNSLYQLLVRSQLKGTQLTLKNWLLQGSTKEDILARQFAISELLGDTDWRQEVTAYGQHGSTKKEASETPAHVLVSWLGQQLDMIDRPIWMVLQFLIPVFSAVLIVGFWLADWSHIWLYAPILLNLVLLRKIFRPLTSITKEFDNLSHFLKSYQQVFLTIESKQFQSPLLQKLSENLNNDQGSASKAFKSLNGILHFLQNRTNVFYLPFNLLFLTDLMVLRRALKWKKQYVHRIESWFESVHEIDALSDISSFAYSNPDMVFPTISDEQCILKSTALSHPLIKKNQRIVNDFTIESQGQLGLVTGSNMSGKSTFLRTVGVNLVLGQMGAPVSAVQFEFSLCSIFTCMRTQDNLEENVSSFYAELKRIKQMLDSLNDKRPTFYMLDEILKGTNSEDRHKGAISLIDQLTHHHCMGLISTHDIQLSELSQSNRHIQNYSFNSTIEGDEILFDYKLTFGACRSFNASKLMEKMGIIQG